MNQLPAGNHISAVIKIIGSSVNLFETGCRVRSILILPPPACRIFLPFWLMPDHRSVQSAIRIYILFSDPAINCKRTIFLKKIIIIQFFPSDCEITICIQIILFPIIVYPGITSISSIRMLPVAFSIYADPSLCINFTHTF